jgi:hypothetical protein
MGVHILLTKRQHSTRVKTILQSPHKRLSRGSYCQTKNKTQRRNDGPHDGDGKEGLRWRALWGEQRGNENDLSFLGCVCVCECKNFSCFENVFVLGKFRNRFPGFQVFRVLATQIPHQSLTKYCIINYTTDYSTTITLCYHLISQSKKPSENTLGDCSISFLFFNKNSGWYW